MRSFFRWIVFLTIVAGLSACGAPKGAKLQKSVVPPDKTLFQNGADFLERSMYTQARLAFQTLIQTYPGSELEPEAYFAMGDSFMKEGGTDNLLQAEDRFRNFIIFFPTNPKAPDAQMKIISILMGQMRTPDRDMKETERAEAEILNFLRMFPNNDFVQIAKGYLDEVREVLAQHDLVIGDYYAHNNNPFGATGRYKGILEKYPRFSQNDVVYFNSAREQLKLAEALKQMEAATEAANSEKLAVEYLGKIAEGFPFSKHFEESRALLAKLGKAVPPINTELAQKNQALIRPEEPFSPLKPLRDLADAMGFLPAPDRYRVAKKAIEDAKAAAAAAAPAVQPGAKPTDPRINLGTIEKGADAKVTPPAADKKTDQKKDEKKADDKAIKKKAN
jgi:outer membrane protein assembly factor BamD